jgi:hypothetical protein
LAKEWIVLSAITNAVKSSLPSSSPAPPNKQPVQAQGPATPAGSGTPEQPQGPATPAASGKPAPPSEQPQGPATPGASETSAPPSGQPQEPARSGPPRHRHRPNNRSKRKGPPRRQPPEHRHQAHSATFPSAGDFIVRSA